MCVLDELNIIALHGRLAFRLGIGKHLATKIIDKVGQRALAFIIVHDDADDGTVENVNFLQKRIENG